MKIYILLLTTILTATFSACDYNDSFDGFDELSKPTNVLAGVSYTFATTDITSIVTALNANKNVKDSATAKTLNADKMFSDQADARILIPYFLKTKYYAADVKSSVKVTYQYKEGRNQVVRNLSTAPYAITDSDYKLIWGDNAVTAFTPEKSPEKSIPVILTKNVTAPVEGMFKNVEYYYSKEEPVTTIVESEIFEEDFNSYPAGSGVLVAIDGWINKDLKGAIGWQNRTYSNNNYAQVSSYNTKAVNDVRLITKIIDLTGTTSPKFTFDIVVGNFTASCLSIEVSENFSGKDANITTATWKDVTSSFTIPQPASGYTTWASAGTLDLKAYKGKKIYISFKYSGDDTSTPKKTTTYQIDNVRAFDEISGIDVKNKELRYTPYKYRNAKWQSAADSVITLQPTDYDAMGLKFLTTAQAPDFLPAFLGLKFPFAQEGDAKTITYKVSATSCYADEYVFSKGKWSVNTFILEKTDQFVLSTLGWVFDPTLHVTMKKGKENTDDYMMIVNYVKAHEAIANPALVSSYGDSEYYYGFSGNYGNISYRESDRSLDTTYPKSGTTAEKAAFMDQRAIEGIKVYLTLKFPDTQPQVNGIDQLAEVTVLIYSNPIGTNTNENWTYTLQCVGNKEWKYIQRQSQYGTIEKAE
ncbi:choice-of-anchor J domain-containing protein [Dysgonomonas alginatilytica]|nr:choice-of-anchor J domain-containing protein [Dysgonomonas alginatilytica]